MPIPVGLIARGAKTLLGSAAKKAVPTATKTLKRTNKRQVKKALKKQRIDTTPKPNMNTTAKGFQPSSIMMKRQNILGSNNLLDNVGPSFSNVKQKATSSFDNIKNTIKEKMPAAKNYGKKALVGAVTIGGLSAGAGAAKKEYDRTNEENQYKYAREESVSNDTLRDVGIMLGIASVANMIIKKDVGAPIDNVIKGATKFGDILRKGVARQFRSGKEVNKIYEIIRDDLKKDPNIMKALKDTYGHSEAPVKTKLDKMLAGVGAGIGIGTGNLLVHAVAEKRLNDERIKKSFGLISDPTKVRDATKNADFLEGLEKTAKEYRNLGHRLKKILVEDVAQKSVLSVPYFMVPVALSNAMNKNIKGHGEKVNKPKQKKIIIDVPANKLEGFINKKASFSKAKNAKLSKLKNAFRRPKYHKIKTWKEVFKDDMPEAIGKSIAWTVPITALSMLAGRNFRSGGQKIEKETPLRPNDVRVTIEASPRKQDLFRSNTISYMPKMASDESIKKNEKSI